MNSYVLTSSAERDFTGSVAFVAEESPVAAEHRVEELAWGVSEAVELATADA